MDNEAVKKVLTFKSGQFVFSHKFSHSTLAVLLVEAKVLCKIIDDLPILPTLSAGIEDELIRKSIFSTAAIEGNPLREEQVSEILTSGSTKEKTVQAEKEIGNLKEAYDYLKGVCASTEPYMLTEEAIRSVHKMITKDIEHDYNIPGAYRNNVVQVGDSTHGGVYTPPKVFDDIHMLMNEFISWINSKELIGKGPVIRAGLAHYHFGLIHPFADGNGRTARLIEAMLLRASGIKYVPIMLSNYYYRNMDDYYMAFSKTLSNTDGETTLFLEFFIKGLRESANDIKDKIAYFIRKFTLGNYYDFLLDKGMRIITQRQHDLLRMLLEDNKEFGANDLFTHETLKILYRGVSERTAKRDLKKLVGGGFLTHKDNKYYLNMHVLDSFG